jgi:hypothetical protein
LTSFQQWGVTKGHNQIFPSQTTRWWFETYKTIK